MPWAASGMALMMPAHDVRTVAQHIPRPGSSCAAVPDIDAVIDPCQLFVADGDAAVDESDLDFGPTTFGWELVEPHRFTAPIRCLGQRQWFQGDGVHRVGLKVRPVPPQTPVAGARLHE